MRMQINRNERGRYFPLDMSLTTLTAVVLVGSVVAVLHAIAIFAVIDALAVSAYELVRSASWGQKRDISRYCKW